MRLLALFAAAGFAFAAGAANAQSVEIKDAVARVTVIPEARKDVKVEILNRNSALPLDVRVHGDRTVIDGNLARKVRSCNGTGGRTRVSVAGRG